MASNDNVGNRPTEPQGSPAGEPGWNLRDRPAPPSIQGTNPAEGGRTIHNRPAPPSIGLRNTGHDAPPNTKDK